jgi:hypothetical protein
MASKQQNLSCILKVVARNAMAIGNGVTLVVNKGGMTSGQIDRLCQDWLRENYGEAIASEYTPHSLLIPAFNSTDLNSMLEELRQNLCLAFGPEQSFGSTDYYEARERLGLTDDRTPVPDVFVMAFVGT